MVPQGEWPDVGEKRKMGSGPSLAERERERRRLSPGSRREKKMVLTFWIF